MKLLLDSENVKKALELATRVHKGQVDKAGVDYINHPVAVASKLETEEEQTVALLHDVLEDTPTIVEDLQRAGFSKRVCDAVYCLTRQKDEPRESYIERVSKNPLARKVKLADLTHNSDLSRIPSPTEKDFERRERYQKEMVFLRGVQE